ncbi:unnamed protein product [Polarella glacialis]|uniref:PCI domain-containing protein n=1 Tax=Polarella glacialis TaxID=89957 RepID=A0A813JKP1_POLGL|nr:unnamed protein product [Polarella glacialis]
MAAADKFKQNRSPAFDAPVRIRADRAGLNKCCFLAFNHYAGRWLVDQFPDGIVVHDTSRGKWRLVNMAGRHLPDRLSTVLFARGSGTAQHGEGKRATSFQDAAVRVCDFKGLARPSTFSGRDQDWPEFRYRFESLATLLGFDQLLDQASKMGFDGLDVDLFTEEDHAKSRFVHAMLVQLCSGKALSLVKLTPKINGFDAWSALVHEYEPELVSRYCALLAAILTPEWVPTSPFVEQLIEWERLVSRCELSSGQRLSESVKCAVILRWAPDTVKEVLKTLPADVVESYPRLRNALQQARVRALTYDSQGLAQVPEHRATAVPMEVDALPKGRSKGKGKMQGTQYPQQSADQSGKDKIRCQWRGKMGHVLKECYKFLGQGGFAAMKPMQRDQLLSKGQGVHVLGDAPWNETLSGVWKMPDAAMEPGTQQEWCMQLADAQPKVCQDMLMVDSGAFDHVCPVTFMPDVPIQPMDGDASPAIAADGTPLAAIGHKVVRCVLQTGRRLRIRFKVMPIKRPLLSVRRLRRQGYGSYFPPESLFQGGGEAFLTHCGEKVPLQEHRGLFFLAVCFPNVNALDDQQGQPGLEDFIEPLSQQRQQQRRIQQQQAERDEVMPLPSPQERQQHDKTHLPYQGWCPTCVASRAADDPRRRQKAVEEDSVPVVECDYGYIQTGQPDDTAIPVFVAKAKHGGYGFAAVSPAKGRGSTSVIQGMLRFLAEAGLTGRLILRSDQEMAVQAVAQAAAAQRQAPTMVEVTRKGSSSSLGTGEKYIRDLMSQVRVCCEQAQQIWGQQLAASSSLMPWVVTRAAWTMNRFSRDAPYTKAQGHEYHGAVFRFSEPVMVKNVGNLTRLQPRWTPGVWLGRTSDGDENLAATAQGLLIGRSARAMERAVLPEDLLAKAVGAMSTPRPGESELPQSAQDRQTPAVHVGPSRAVGGAAAPRGVELRAFHQAVGKTPGCVACDEPGGKQHTAKCKWRRAHWQEQAAETTSESTAKRRAVEVPEEDVRLVPRRIAGKSLAPSWALAPAGPAGPGNEEMPGSSTKRTAEDDGAWEQEETEARLRSEPDEEMAEQEIAVVNRSSKTEPPWHSDRDGSLLDPGQVEQGMAKERQSLRDFRVYAEVDESEPQSVGAKIVPSAWVLGAKHGGVKARLVAQQVNTGGWADTFAATPSGCAHRLLLLVAARKQWPVQLGDVSTAFLHASLPQPVYLRPPATERKRLITEPQLFVHEPTGAMATIHADDMLLTAPAKARARLMKEIEGPVKMKWTDTVTEDQGVRFLGKEYRRIKDGFAVRVPPVYYEKLLEMFRLETCRSVISPAENVSDHGTKGGSLSDQQVSQYRTAVGKLMWLIHERADLAYVVKELARNLREPTTIEWGRLKRCLRYVRGTTNAEQHLTYNPQESETLLQVMVDANWARDGGRKSTSGGVLFLQGFPLEHWSKTQANIALSSGEAELYAMNSGGIELRHISNVCADLWLQEEFRRGHIRFQKIATADNVADLLTKPLTGPATRGLCTDLGLMLQPEEVQNEINVLGEYPPPMCPRCVQLADIQASHAGQLFWECLRCRRHLSWTAYNRGWDAWTDRGTRPEATADEQRPVPPMPGGAGQTNMPYITPAGLPGDAGFEERKRGQLKRAITDMVLLAMGWLDALDKEQKLDLIGTLNEVTDGKIFVEVEKARLTKMMAEMKEAEGNIEEAANLLQEVQVESFGAMEKREKTEYILNQMRLVLAKKDYVRTQIISKKINPKLLEQEDVMDLKIEYYQFMVRYWLHEKQFLDVAKSYMMIFRTKSVQEDEAKWMPVLTAHAIYLTLSPYNNEQDDMLHRIDTLEKKKLDKVPFVKALIKIFLKKEIVAWPLANEKELRSHPVFQDTPHEGASDRWDLLKKRVVQHNIKVVSEYYEQIHTTRLCELIGLGEKETEAELSELVCSKFVFARIDRPAGTIKFGKKQTYTDRLNTWSDSITKMLDLVENSCHLIQKEQMVHAARAKLKPKK